MKRPPKRGGSGRQPESVLVEELTNFLKIRDWLVKKTHGNKFQSGLPDLFLAHREYGVRWVEVKLPTRGKNPFTAAQMTVFQEFAAKNVGVWVLVAATDNEYQKLWKPANWIWFLHTPDVSGL